MRPFFGVNGQINDLYAMGSRDPLGMANLFPGSYNPHAMNNNPHFGMGSPNPHFGMVSPNPHFGMSGHNPQFSMGGHSPHFAMNAGSIPHSMGNFIPAHSLGVPGGNCQSHSMMISSNTPVYSSYTGNFIQNGPLGRNVPNDAPPGDINYGKNWSNTVFNECNNTCIAYGGKR